MTIYTFEECSGRKSVMTTPCITLTPGRTGTDVWSDTPHPCPVCHVMAYWWRNQSGATVCIRCAEELTDVDSRS
jgi:hypothetical protein